MVSKSLSEDQLQAIDTLRVLETGHNEQDLIGMTTRLETLVYLD